MILLKLVLTNFKGFLGEHIFKLNRSPGLYFVTGDNQLNPELGANGCGKSTLLCDALMWVLWNKTERDNRPAAAIEPWDMEKGTSSVSLLFSHLGKTQIITRSRKPNALTLAFKDHIREITQDDVASIVGMNEELFRNSVIFGQFGVLFLDLGAEAQSQIFNDALNLDIYLKAARLAGDKQNVLKLEVQTLEQEISKLTGQIGEIKTNIIEANKNSSNFNKQKDYEIEELETFLDQKKRELLQLIVKLDLAPPQELPHRGLAIKAIERLIADQRRSWKLLGRDTADISVDLGSMDTMLKMMKTNIEEYEEALRNNQACPTCGQKMPTDHVRGKIEGLLTKKFRLERQITSLTERHTIMKANYTEAEHEIEKLGLLLKLVEKGYDKYDHASSMLNITRNKEDPYAGVVIELTKRKKAQSTARKAKRSDRDNKLTDIGRYLYWGSAYKEIRLGIIDDVLLELGVAVMGHISNLGLEGWRIEFATERETKSGNVSFSFTTLLYPPNQDEPIKWESYSGGESQRWQLGVSFALSEVLLERSGASTNIEVLDEPTRGLSPQGVNILLEYLAQRARTLERVIYFVDQHSLGSGNFDHVFTITKDEEGSHIT